MSLLPFYSQGHWGSEGLMKWQSGDLGSGFIFDFKSLHLAIITTLRVPSQLSAGPADRPDVLRPLVNGECLHQKGRLPPIWLPASRSLGYAVLPTGIFSPTKTPGFEMWAVQTCFLKDHARTQQNTSPGQKWPSVVNLCSLHETGHSSVPWRIVAILCMSQNKPLQGQELEVWKMMYSEFTSLYKGSPVWAALVLILPCVHFAVMIVVCRCQAAKAETIF